MAYPTTDWPGAIDGLLPRVDGVDIVWADEFNYLDSRFQAIQTWLGVTGELMGAGVAAEGPGGLLSPVTDGAGVIGLQLVARDSFAVGKLLAVGDDYDAAPPAYTQKFAIDANGVLELVPHALAAAATQGRVGYKSGTNEGLFFDDGTDWKRAGPPFARLELGQHEYTQVAVPVEEVVSSFTFDASLVGTGGTVGAGTLTFMVVITNIFAATGIGECTYVRLYDLGSATVPAAATLISERTFTANGGPVRSTDTLTVAALPALGQVASSDRMYQVRVYQDVSTVGDVAVLGSASLEIQP